MVVAVVDATNLARNLYLVLQLLDLGYRVVVALNLVDEARRRAVEIDAARLAARLGVPVVPTVAPRGEGVDELKRGGRSAWRPRRTAPAAALSATTARRVEERLDELTVTVDQRSRAARWRSA